jgi:glycosyltransferase involved in cell wall biosynthesis
MERSPRLVMLGAAPGMQGAMASVIDAYRTHGLFRRWPVDYIATHGGGGAAGELRLAARAVSRLGELVGRHRGLVVHAHFAPRTGFWRQAGLASLAATMRCPLVVQLHGGGFDRFYDACSAPARHAVRRLLEQAACVLTPTEAMRMHVQKLARNARALCLPVPVALAPQPSPAARQRLVLYLGRLEADRGVFDLLESFALVHRTVPDARLVCAGVGPRERERAPAALARYAERLGIGEAVKLIGWVGPSGKRALFESACAFALPAGDEGLPLALLEAMASGVAPIAAGPGAAEVVVDGVSGFLVPPGDVAALARHMAGLLVDPELSERLGAAARESVRVRFAPERAIARLEEVYADVGLTLESGHMGQAA